MRRLLVLALVTFAAAPSARAQGYLVFNGRNHPELDWRVAETEHFRIVYPAHLAGIEAEAAAVAEASYRALSESFGGVTFDEKIRVYLSDEDEIANGVAYEVGGGHTNVWVHVNDFADTWTGDAKWLRKVLAHELAHLFHYRAVRSGLGLVQNLVADPLPSFWAEGLAQYLTERWDAQRGDRWLRTAAFESRLGYDDGQSAWNGRLKYAVGNSQVRYLAWRYGDSTIVRLLEHRRTAIPGLPKVHDFRAAFRAAVGKPYGEFVEEWRKHVNVYYNTLAGQMERADSLSTDALALPGQYLYDVQFSPDTTQIAAVALTSIARPVRRLFVMQNPGADSTRRRVRVLAEGALEGPLAWSPDGRQIAYARQIRGENGSLVNDLFLVDVATGRTRRLTRDRRAASPTFAADGQRLAFVGVERGTGTANVFALDLATGRERPLTAFEGDVQITAARWSPAGERIALAVFTAAGRRELMLLDASSGALTTVPTGEGLADSRQDSRDPIWSPDGHALAFTSLRDDAPNVFVVPVGAAPPVVSGREPMAEANEPGTNGRVAVFPAEAWPAAGSTLARSSAPRDSATGHLVPSPYPEPFGGEPFGGEAFGGETRVTYLFAGASVRDWLPPDSTHPAGRLVLTTSETKRRERAVLVDAARRPTVDPSAPPAVPPAYAAWTAHRPAREIPWRIAPDSGLVTRRYGYNSLRNLTHAITLPLPYADPEQNDYGVFANSIWLEPLGKHQLFVLGGVSFTRFVDRSFLLLSYTNNTLAPALTLDLYRFPSPSSFYGDRVLVEDLTGGDLSATLPLDVTARPFTTVLAGARVRYAYAEPFSLDSLAFDVGGSGLPQPEEGFRADLQLGAAYKFQRPYRYNVIHPLDGAGVRARVTLGAPVLGSRNEFVRPDVAAFWVSPEIGIGRLFLYGRATALLGRPLAQDYVGLGKYDDVDVQLPFVGALTLDDAERVRGYRRYAIGTRVLFGTAEYRLPPVFDLSTNLLGLVALGRLGFSGFVDGGLVWTGADLGDAVRRTGVGLEAKNVLSIGGFELLHSLGVAVPWGDLDENLAWGDVDLYYRLQAAVPF